MDSRIFKISDPDMGGPTGHKWSESERNNNDLINLQQSLPECAALAIAEMVQYLYCDWVSPAWLYLEISKLRNERQGQGISLSEIIAYVKENGIPNQEALYNPNVVRHYQTEGNLPIFLIEDEHNKSLLRVRMSFKIAELTFLPNDSGDAKVQKLKSGLQGNRPIAVGVEIFPQTWHAICVYGYDENTQEFLYKITDKTLSGRISYMDIANKSFNAYAISEQNNIDKKHIPGTVYIID